MSRYQLWALALHADDAFQAQLEREYGANAGDMRYRSDRHSVAVAGLRDAYQRAMEAYLAAGGAA